MYKECVKSQIKSKVSSTHNLARDIDSLVVHPSFAKMQSLILLGLLGSTAYVAAHPTSPKNKHALRPRVIDLNNFRLKATANYVNKTEVASNPPITSIGILPSSYVDTATALVKEIVPGAEFRLVDDHYVGTNGIAHVNFKQTAHGLDIDNSDFNVNVGLHIDPRMSACGGLIC